MNSHSNTAFAPAPATAPRGQIDVTADSIEGSLTTLSVLLTTLQDRLAPVLQPSVPQPQTAAQTGSSNYNTPVGSAIPISPAVERLVAQRRRVEDMSAFLGDLLSRLDT